MIKKILVLCIICCFLSSTLYAQTVSFEQHAISVQIASTSIRKKLDVLIEQLDRDMSIKPSDMENIITDLQGIDYDVREMSGDLNNVLSSDSNLDCQKIRWISLTWGAIGIFTTTSLLVCIVRLVIKQSTPGIFPKRHERKLVRQYLKCARKLLVSSVIVPISFINVLLAHHQYRECLVAD